MKSSAPPFRPRSGFSLVEVVLALGIAAFALMTLVALLPQGISLIGESEEEARAVNALTQVLADREASPALSLSERFKLPSARGLTGVATGSFGLDGGGVYQENPNLEASRLRISYRLTPPASNSAAPPLLWLRASWPAQNTNALNGVEILSALSAD